MEKRIRWIDIFKGMLILLVVLGHTTGIFNSIIYQFHVGAFFILSGYTAKKSNRNFGKNVILRFLSLGMPLIVSFVLILLVGEILNYFGLYSIFFSNNYYNMIFFIQEFLKGNVYISWLGASWFIIVLFGIFLYRECISIFIKKTNIYIELMISIIIMAVAYMIQNIIGVNIVILILYGQFFYVLGHFFSETDLLNRIFFSKGMIIVGFFLSCIWVGYFKSKNYTMDFVSGKFPNLFLAVVMIINGFFLSYIVSIVIEKKGKIIANFLENIGKNTMGILLFHFIGFKVAYIPFLICKKIEVSDIALLVPPENIGQIWWWLIVIISVSFSYFLWKLICSNKITKTLFGQEKSINIKLTEFIFKNKLVTYAITGIIHLGTICGIGRNINFEKVMVTCEQLFKNGYYISNIWDDGFLSQEAEIIIMPDSGNEIEMNLYNPENFGENSISIYIDGIFYSVESLQLGSNVINFSIENGSKVKLIFENTTIPAQISESGDMRELSCILADIKIK